MRQAGRASTPAALLRGVGPGLASIIQPPTGAAASMGVGVRTPFAARAGKQVANQVTTNPANARPTQTSLARGRQEMAACALGM
jgi:hypothetical protein